MCDLNTESENAAFLQQHRLNRRQLNLGTGAALASLLSGCTTKHVAAHAAHETVGTRVTVPTADGSAEAFFVTPRTGKHPAVLMWPDVAGLRDAFVEMASQLAAEGYAVLCVNPYYRNAALPILTHFSEWKTPEGQAKIEPMRAALTPERISRDAAAYVAWLDQQPAVDLDKKIATLGYCMGGPFTFRTAHAAQQRVGIVASFHGGGLVTDAPDSPHLLLKHLQLSALVCIAQNDDARAPQAKDTLRSAAQQAQLEAEIEVYPAQHGWCVLDSPVHDPEQAKRAWLRLLATLQRNA